MVRRNHQQVGGRLRVQILEGHHAVGPLEDGRRDLARRDLAEDAPGHESPLLSDFRTPAAAAPGPPAPPGPPPGPRPRPRQPPRPRPAVPRGPWWPSGL